MHLNIPPSTVNICASGTGSHYVCSSSNGFSGCCTVDPCELSTCPDKKAKRLVVVTTLILSAQPPLSTGTAVQTSSFVYSTTQILPATTSSSSNADAMAVQSTSTTLPSSSSTPDSPPILTAVVNHSAVIAAVVCGMVLFAVISILGWVCLRRRQKAIESQARHKTCDSMFSKDFVLDRYNTGDTELSRKNSNDVISPRTRENERPQSLADEQPPRNEITTESADLVEASSETRVPLGFEKARLRTPPVHEHPMYANPEDSYHPSITSHPAYHISQLSNHPAFRSVQVSNIPSTRSHHSMHTAYQNSTPRLEQIDEMVSPIASSPLMSSPIAGHLELEADVPDYYVSPVTTHIPRCSSMMQLRTDTNPSTQRKSSNAVNQNTSTGLHNRAYSAASTSSATSSVLSTNFVPMSNPTRNSLPAPIHPKRTTSQPFISLGGEIVSVIERPQPRSSPQAVRNQPIISVLESSHTGPRRIWAEEKEIGLSIPSPGEHPSERWSDLTMVPPAPAATASMSRTMSMSVPDMISAARLAASPNLSYQSGGGCNSPASTCTNENTTWGSWGVKYTRR